MARTGNSSHYKCVKCKEIKPRDEFSSGTYKNGQYYKRAYCKPCWNAHNREKYHNGGKSAYLKRIFGITLERFNEILKLQDGKCAICGKPEGINAYSFAVDHDHLTGEVRGLLCARCNTGLGVVEDAEFIGKAFAYLEKSQVPIRVGG